MDELRWKELMLCNSRLSDDSMLDVDAGVSREELWRQLRMATRGYEKGMSPGAYRRARDLEKQVERLQAKLNKLSAAPKSRMEIETDPGYVALKDRLNKLAKQNDEIVKDRDDYLSKMNYWRDESRKVKLLERELKDARKTISVLLGVIGKSAE